MDGNNFGNNYGGENTQNNGVNNQNQNNQYTNYQYTNYQDNTANNAYYQPPVDNGVENKADGKQIAGLVFGILAICTSCCYGVPGIVFGIVGLILSIMGNKESKHGVGIAGLVCSIIGLVIGIAMTVYFAAIFAMVFSGEYGDYMDLINDLNSMYN